MGKKRQLQLGNFFKKSGLISNEFMEIEQRIKALEEKLHAKQTQLFEIQRNSYKQPITSQQKKSEIFIRPEIIGSMNSVEVLKQKLEHLTDMTGLEVQSFLKNDHCCVVFHMQHNSPNIVRHGLRIEMKTDSNEVTGKSLPVGFQLDAVVDNYDNILRPQYLLSIHKALIAYYERLKQYEELRTLLSMNGTLFRSLDTSHVEVTFYINIDENDQDAKVTLIFDYRVHDTLPKSFDIRTKPESIDAIENLQAQCILFRKKSLRNAFKRIFMDDGQWQMVDQFGIPREHVRAKRLRPNKNPNVDDTFHPEECSDQGEDEELAE